MAGNKTRFRIDKLEPAAIVSLILPLWGIVLIVLGIKDGSAWWIASGVAIGAAGAVTFIGSPLMDFGARERCAAGQAQKRQPRFITESASRKSQALALGREDTASCHRARFFCSGVIRSLISLAKSIATSAVMSAMV